MNFKPSLISLYNETGIPNYPESLGYFVAAAADFDFGFVSFCKRSIPLNGVLLERKNHWCILSKENISMSIGAQ